MLTRTAHELPPFNCRPEEFRCYDNHQCVSKDRVCDGRVHCSDWSDEDPALCGERSKLQKPSGIFLGIFQREGED